MCRALSELHSESSPPRRQLWSAFLAPGSPSPGFCDFPLPRKRHLGHACPTQAHQALWRQTCGCSFTAPTVLSGREPSRLEWPQGYVAMSRDTLGQQLHQMPCRGQQGGAACTMRQSSKARAVPSPQGPSFQPRRHSGGQRQG